jgi:dihydrofolate reductase
MRQLIATEWVSLDGIFDSSSMEQWFNPYHSDSRAKYIQDTIQNCDAMLYGRNTYEMLFPYWSSLKNNEMGVADKLNKAKKYVVSSTLKEANWENSTIS